LRKNLEFSIPIKKVLQYTTNSMEQTHRIVETLKKILKVRGLTYKTLAQKLRMSEANLKRTFSKRAFTLKRLEEICQVLEIDFYDLAKQAKGHVQDVVESLNIEQERALAQDAALFSIFYLVLAGMNAKQIDRAYDFQGKTQQLLIKLDRLGLIELHPKDRIKLLVTSNVRWLTHGPLTSKYEGDIKKEFLGTNFLGKNEKLRLLSGHFSESAIKMMSVKIERLLGEFLELSEAETHYESAQGQRQWLLLAYRPWTFSVLERYQRRRV
jgi:DNA-binding Xre family transcriptional regulator